MRCWIWSLYDLFEALFVQVTDKAVMVSSHDSADYSRLVDVCDRDVLVSNSYADCRNLTVRVCDLADVILYGLCTASAPSGHLIRLKSAIDVEVQPHLKDPPARTRVV